MSSVGFHDGDGLVTQFDDDMMPDTDHSSHTFEEETSRSSWAEARGREVGWLASSQIANQRSKRRGASSDELGDVYVWGEAFNLAPDGHTKFGLLGLGQTMYMTPVPTRVPALSNKGLKTVTFGKDHAVALSEEGSVFTWGGGSFGQLGHGNVFDVWQPKFVEALRQVTVTHVEAGSEFSCVLSASGNVYTWGRGDEGQLGQNKLEHNNIPDQVAGLDDKTVVSIKCNLSNTLAVTDFGYLYSWGAGRDGTLGHGDLLDYAFPKMVSGLSEVKIKHVFASNDFCAVTVGLRVDENNEEKVAIQKEIESRQNPDPHGSLFPLDQPRALDSTSKISTDMAVQLPDLVQLEKAVPDNIMTSQDPEDVVDLLQGMRNLASMWGKLLENKDKEPTLETPTIEYSKPEGLDGTETMEQQLTEGIARRHNMDFDDNDTSDPALMVGYEDQYVDEALTANAASAAANIPRRIHNGGQGMAGGMESQFEMWQKAETDDGEAVGKGGNGGDYDDDDDDGVRRESVLLQQIKVMKELRDTLSGEHVDDKRRLHDEIIKFEEMLGEHRREMAIQQQRSRASAKQKKASFELRMSGISGSDENIKMQLQGSQLLAADLLKLWIELRQLFSRSARNGDMQRIIEMQDDHMRAAEFVELLDAKRSALEQIENECEILEADFDQLEDSGIPALFSVLKDSVQVMKQMFIFSMFCADDSADVLNNPQLLDIVNLFPPEFVQLALDDQQ